jgi:hypothetical protein
MGAKVARKSSMPRLNAPTKIVFLISLILAIIALLGAIVFIPVISLYAFWIAIIAYIVLAAGCVLKGV